MNDRIRCYTLFDITKTGLVKHRKSTSIPFYDSEGQLIDSEAKWQQSRNQQRNFETLVQLLSLRTQPQELDRPRKTIEQDLEKLGLGNYGKNSLVWNLDFTVEFDSIFKSDTDNLGLLRDDFDKIPMITGLGETVKLQPYSETRGRFANISFIMLT
jgi:hypothetical protein